MSDGAAFYKSLPAEYASF